MEIDLMTELNFKMGNTFSKEKFSDYDKVKDKTEYTIKLTAPGFKENPRPIPKWKEDEIRAQVQVLICKRMVFQVDPKKAICISNIVVI